MMRITLLFALAAAVSAIHAPETHRTSSLPVLARYINKKTINPIKNDVMAIASKIKNSFDAFDGVEDDHAMATCSEDNVNVKTPMSFRGGECTNKFCGKLLAGAYTACGLATTAAWSTIVYTTIRSNQPQGAMMPTWQHGFFARIGALSAVPLIGSAFYTLAKSASEATSWEEMGTPSSRRHNLAIAAAGVGSALWTGFAPLLTKIPGTDPLQSHQAYSGAMRTGLISGYGAAAALGALVWARSLPEDVRGNPLLWPARIADGVSKSLVSLAPASLDDPVNVKYALLTSSFLVFTGLQLGSHPLSVIPSWTGRRLARAFPAWTLLAATTAFDLKEATENGTLLDSPTARALSTGLKGFGATYLGARCGAVLGDPSWPHSYHAVVQVPAWATAAIFMVGLTLRSDRKEAKYYVK